MSVFKSLIVFAVLALAVQGRKQCGENEEFRRCGTACEPTCSKPGRIFCTRQCIVDVCQCRLGYSRDNSGKCIRTELCSHETVLINDSQCPASEHFNSCGGCDSTCENQNAACIEICGPGACRCNSGLVRNPDGVCVSVSQCPPGNESQSQCASVTCLTGSQCVVQFNRPVCVPNGSEDNADLNNPCKTHKCNVDEKCVETKVNCFVPPCYPTAECLTTKYDEDQSPCYTVRCGFNTECKAIDGTARCIPRD